MLVLHAMDIFGSVSSSAPISVGNSSPIGYTLSAGKKGALLENLGSKIAWWGGATVDGSSNIGGRMHPGEKFWFRATAAGASIYFLCTGTDTTTIGVNEYADTA